MLPSPAAFSQTVNHVNQTQARIELIKSLTDKAEQGNVHAQFALAETLRKSSNEHPFIEAYANAWLLRAAKAGQADAIKLAYDRGLMSIPTDQSEPAMRAQSREDFPPSMTPPEGFVIPNQTVFIVTLAPTSEDGRAVLTANDVIGQFVQASETDNDTIRLGPFYDRAQAVNIIEIAAGLGSFTSRLEPVTPR